MEEKRQQIHFSAMRILLLRGYFMIQKAIKHRYLSVCVALKAPMSTVKTFTFIKWFLRKALLFIMLISKHISKNSCRKRGRKEAFGTESNTLPSFILYLCMNNILSSFSPSSFMGHSFNWWKFASSTQQLPSKAFWVNELYSLL